VKTWNLARFAERRWALAALSFLAVVGLLLVALVVYTATELRRFERQEARRGTLVYAGGQWVGPGVNLRVVDLAGSLGRLRYVESRGRPRGPGQFQRRADGWEIVLRTSAEGTRREPQRVRLETSDERITDVQVDGKSVGGTTLEPEVLTSIDDRAGEEYRPVRLGDVPITLLSAILAAEDHRFFDHAGLDLRGVMRAAWANLRAGRVTQGGSTITQQLVKNRLLSARRSYARKVREAWLAALVEWRYPKERILESYLNEIYLGQHGPLAVRGVGAAARAYFNKEVHQLTLAESALIAGMVRAPNTYSPFINRDRARERRDVILARMLELGKIVEAEYAAARREPVRVQRAGVPGQSAPYFSDRVRQEIEDSLGADLAELAAGQRIGRLCAEIGDPHRHGIEIVRKTDCDIFRHSAPLLRTGWALAKPRHNLLGKSLEYSGRITSDGTKKNLLHPGCCRTLNLPNTVFGSPDERKTFSQVCFQP